MLLREPDERRIGPQGGQIAHAVLRPGEVLTKRGPSGVEVPIFVQLPRVERIGQLEVRSAFEGLGPRDPRPRRPVGDLGRGDPAALRHPLEKLFELIRPLRVPPDSGGLLHVVPVHREEVSGMRDRIEGREPGELRFDATPLLSFARRYRLAQVSRERERDEPLPLRDAIGVKELRIPIEPAVVRPPSRVGRPLVGEEEAVIDEHVLVSAVAQRGVRHRRRHRRRVPHALGRPKGLYLSEIDAEVKSIEVKRFVELVEVVLVREESHQVLPVRAADELEQPLAIHVSQQPEELRLVPRKALEERPAHVDVRGDLVRAVKLEDVREPLLLALGSDDAPDAGPIVVSVGDDVLVRVMDDCERDGSPARPPERVRRRRMSLALRVGVTRQSGLVVPSHVATGCHLSCLCRRRRP